jgi:hypothetical protein
LTLFDIQTGYSFDPHTAVIRSRDNGWRVLLMTSDALSSLQDGLYRKFSTGASVIILEMGFSYGSMLFESLNQMATIKGPEADPPNAKALVELMMKTGCGKLTIEGDTERGNNLTVTAKSCVFCEGRSPDYTCNFLRGIVLGLSTGLYAKQYKSRVDCKQINNEHVCHIELLGK